MSRHPLVSIALTTSKSEKFIREQMDSLLDQTYSNLEVVVSHDECGDNTVSILEEYRKKDGRVRWEYNQGKKGIIKNTENAILMCRGDIIFLCDHDDSWSLEKVEEHVCAYEDSTVDWVCNRLIITDSENKREIGYIEDTLYDYYTKKRRWILNYVWGSCIGGAMTSYRAEVIKSALPIPEYAPAHDSWIQLAIWPAKLVVINKVLQKYRQHENNVVGINKESKESFVDREARAIADNINYLDKLSQNTTLVWWKRILFYVVYRLKKLRAVLRRFVQ